MKKEEKTKGVAALFDQIEIKSFLKNYLIFIGIVEAVIFFVCFVEQLGSKDIPFPWKNYFFAAFIIPVVITFLLGILVAGFNKYLYDFSSHEKPLGSNSGDNPNTNLGYLQKIEAVLVLFQKLPFLLTLFILTLTAGIIYKLDSIIAFISTAGQKSLEYLMMILGAGIGIAAVFIMVWLILKYKLQKKSIEYNHAYRESVMRQLGMVILDDDTVLDKNGNIISGEKTKDSFYQSPLKKIGNLKSTSYLENPEDEVNSK
ncbi:MAG: hypothetical protein RBR53_11530 [Desulforegulaceae bacterium]|nr:hypothetical protein [Desulforegulaceae bacterium]